MFISRRLANQLSLLLSVMTYSCQKLTTELLANEVGERSTPKREVLGSVQDCVRPKMFYIKKYWMFP